MIIIFYLKKLPNPFIPLCMWLTDVISLFKKITQLILSNLNLYLNPNFILRRVNKYPKRISILKYNFRNFFWEKKRKEKLIFLMTFYIFFYKSGVKTFSKIIY